MEKLSHMIGCHLYNFAGRKSIDNLQRSIINHICSAECCTYIFSFCTCRAYLNVVHVVRVLYICMLYIHVHFVFRMLYKIFVYQIICKSFSYLTGNLFYFFTSKKSNDHLQYLWLYQHSIVNHNLVSCW